MKVKHAGEEVRAAAEVEARITSFVDSIISKESALGKLDDETMVARASELKAWDAVKLEGFSIAMESIPVPEEAERTFGKGKAHEDTEQPVETEAEETPRMFAMDNGRIVFTGKTQKQEIGN